MLFLPSPSSCFAGPWPDWPVDDLAWRQHLHDGLPLGLVILGSSVLPGSWATWPSSSPPRSRWPGSGAIAQRRQARSFWLRGPIVSGRMTTPEDDPGPGYQSHAETPTPAGEPPTDLQPAASGIAKREPGKMQQMARGWRRLVDALRRRGERPLSPAERLD